MYRYTIPLYMPIFSAFIVISGLTCYQISIKTALILRGMHIYFIFFHFNDKFRVVFVFSLSLPVSLFLMIGGIIISFIKRFASSAKNFYSLVMDI